MHLIKLDATDSTNAYLKNLSLKKELEDFTVVQARSQLAGRGQMGTRWTSEPGKNLTFSILKKHSNLLARDQFGINMAASLGVFSALEQLQVPNLSIKWPNDILSGTSKICGILIENLTSGSFVQSSILGIGLNVNQLNFGNLEQVSSLQLLMGRPQDLDELLARLLKELENAFGQLETLSTDTFRALYEQYLFRKGKPSTFSDPKGTLFMGFIRGVSPRGKLVIALEDEILKEFDLKEVRLMY